MSDEFHHAYLFEGRHELGKTTIAKRFVQASVCTAKVSPCFECATCKRVERGNAEELTIIDASTITIRNIREIRKAASLQTRKKRFWIIDSYENTTVEARHALLKILEEPSTNVHFILIAQSKKAVLDTIVSRSITVRFYPVSNSAIRDYLTRHGVEVTRDVVAAIAGRPARAVLLTRNKETNFTLHVALLEKILASTLHQRLRYVEDMVKNESLEECFVSWITYFRDGMCQRIQNESGTSNALLAKYSLWHLTKILENLHAALSLLKKRVNKRLVVENICINL